MQYDVSAGVPVPSYLNLRQGDTLPPSYFPFTVPLDFQQGQGGVAVNPTWFQRPVSEGMTAAALSQGIEPQWPSGITDQSGNLLPSTATRSGTGVNPVVRNAIRGLIANLSPSATGNIGYGTQVSGIPRNPNLAGRTGDLYSGYDKTKQQADQSLTDFTDQYLKMRPAMRGALDTESAAIGNVYGSGPGSLSSDLASARTARAAAVRGATSSALARASRANNLARMNSGPSSYLDRLLAQEYARISSGAAADQADQAHADALGLADRRASLAGRRNLLAGQYLDQSLSPAEAAYRFDNLAQSDLGNIGQLENANTIYDVTTPEDRTARQLRLLDTLSNLDQRYQSTL